MIDNTIDNEPIQLRTSHIGWVQDSSKAFELLRLMEKKYARLCAFSTQFSIEYHYDPSALGDHWYAITVTYEKGLSLRQRMAFFKYLDKVAREIKSF